MTSQRRRQVALDHGAVVPNAVGAFVRDRVAQQIVVAKIAHRRGLARLDAFRRRVAAAHGVREQRPGLFLGLIEGQERAMSADGGAARGPGVARAVLHDVAAGAARLDPDAEAGKRFIPDEDIAGAGRQLLDHRFRQLLRRHFPPPPSIG